MIALIFGIILGIIIALFINLRNEQKNLDQVNKLLRERKEHKVTVYYDFTGCKDNETT